MLSTQQAVDLTGHTAWPFVATIALFVLRPYISQVSRAASDLRALLNRSGEMVDLVSQITALNEATSDLKAMQEVDRASRPAASPAANSSTTEVLWKQLEKQWQDTRDAFRSVAQSAGVPVSFIGVVGVREAATTLTEKGVIDTATAAAVIDLSAQYQYMFRTNINRSEYLNENVVSAYTKTATRARLALKSST
jgi:hypothetical protein